MAAMLTIEINNVAQKDALAFMFPSPFAAPFFFKVLTSSNQSRREL